MGFSSDLHIYTHTHMHTCTQCQGGDASKEKQAEKLQVWLYL